MKKQIVEVTNFNWMITKNLAMVSLQNIESNGSVSVSSVTGIASLETILKNAKKYNLTNDDNAKQYGLASALQINLFSVGEFYVEFVKVGESDYMVITVPDNNEYDDEKYYNPVCQFMQPLDEMTSSINSLSNKTFHFTDVDNVYHILEFINAVYKKCKMYNKKKKKKERKAITKANDVLTDAAIEKISNEIIKQLINPNIKE